MYTPSDFHDLVSGRQRGAAAALGRLGLRLAEVPYAWAVSWRNRRYDRGRAEVHRADVPVISVGNITLGGTGKTPTVAWLARWFRARGIRVSIVSRGYGAEAGGLNDEARELEQQLPDVPHLQNLDRLAAARVAVEELETQLIILDDGFQHRRLARDFDIVLLDALAPFGYGHVFPRGTLREPLSGLKRADAVLLSRADMLPPPERDVIRRRVAELNPQALWAEIRHAPLDFISASGERLALDALPPGPVAAFCGLGNPQGFRHTLQIEIGVRVEIGVRASVVSKHDVDLIKSRNRSQLTTDALTPIPFRVFPDHHLYNRADIEELARWAEDLDVTAVLCSQKDLVKIGLPRLGNKPLYALRIAVEFLTGQKGFEERLQEWGQSVSCQ
ncbi:MAG: tetraacyldisaccharide 4'-kinase [Pirellulales bacterium]|nr:tetraacyldisaccharide 4'-kinase [Pirellulales bacterium]